ncbi:AraC family transcriptional regulator [Nocardia sp. CDC160]|uniref:AraC family transcriptional regulator n=1 Tax=Nocardia sp. CDC160 TaxID=3112166 RepID=UPI002DBC4AFB|nr:AraC family transcriptional regulator ligand-binding domain-containing protein [Nocardia sp. CDC160]MEC3916405.1 AraC family transcriptional regulator ligand-binding domain-containing protein [Nocardia sp. CDC160]
MHDNPIPATFAAACLALAARRGWPLPPGVTPIGPESAQTFDPGRVTVLFRHFWRLTGDEMFGLGPNPVPRGAFQLLCLAVSSAPDLGSAMWRFADAAAVFPGLPRFTVEVGAEHTRWAADLRLVDDAEHLMADATVVFAHRLFGWLTGGPLPVRRVEFCYPRPADTTAYERNFQSPLLFDRPRAALVIDNHLLGMAIVQTENALAALLGRAPLGFLDRTDTPQSIGDQVRALLATDPWQTVDDIARRLHISTPTLRRRLHADHTTVSALRDDLLRQAAVTGLTRHHETIAELSTRLGFSEPSAFTRAFRRWTGTTPHHYRAVRGQITLPRTLHSPMESAK